MLNELYSLDMALKEAGISPGVTDQRIQPYPNRLALEVRLGSNGEVVGVAVLSTEKLGAIRKFECSKGGMRESIPGFNVDPLWRLSEVVDSAWGKNWKKAWKAAAKLPSSGKRMGLLRDRWEASQPNWEFADNSKINICLKRASAVFARELTEASDSRLAPLRELLSRCLRTDAGRLYHQLSEKLKDAATSSVSGLSVADYPKLLFSDREAPDGKALPNEAFSLILELDDAGPFGGRPANHQDVWDAVNQHLNSKARPTTIGQESESAGVEGERRGIFGETVPAKLGSMPEKTLPRVGKIKLFSLSAQTPCQDRYGLIESEACPISPEVQDRLAAALEWIGHPDRRQRTWADVSNSSGYKQAALLLAYPSSIPTVDEHLAGLFDSGSTKDVEATAEQDFEACAKVTVGHLEGMINRDPALAITVMVIAKADTARKKLIFSNQFRADRLRQAADDWVAAAKNIPPIELRVFDEKKNRVTRNPRVPFPSDVVRIVNTCWESDGGTPKPVSNIRIGLGLTLLLESGPTAVEAAREAIRPLVRNIAPYILALGQAQQERRVFTAGGPTDTILLAPSVLALIMTKAQLLPIGGQRGDYMNENAYLIGRLLSVADEFQRDYCRRERGGKFPPRFIGNALFLIALENPAKGLAALAQRLPLYQHVTVKDAENERLRDRAGSIIAKIDMGALPVRCSDVEKAQMLLGYLSRSDRDPEVPTP